MSFRPRLHVPGVQSGLAFFETRDSTYVGTMHADGTPANMLLNLRDIGQGGVQLQRVAPLQYGDPIEDFPLHIDGQGLLFSEV